MVADLCWGECGKKVGSFLCYWLCLWVKKKAGFLWVLGLSSRSFGEIEVMDGCFELPCCYFGSFL